MGVLSSLFGESLEDYIRKNDIKKIKEMIDEGANVNARNGVERTPLMYAAENNENPEVIKILLDSGADINASNRAGWTPLMYAARYNENPEVIKILLDSGANINDKNGNGNNALSLAAEYSNNIDVLDILLKEKSNPFEGHYSSISDSLKFRNNNINSESEKYKELVKIGYSIEDFAQECNANLIEKRYEYTDINERDDRGIPVLMYAVMYDREIDIIKSIIEHGAKINMRSTDGTTALMYAAGFHSNVEIIDLLINSGANIKSKNKNGNNASSFAAESNKNQKMINKLMEFGAEVDDKTIIKAIYNSIKKNHNVEAIESLLEMDVDFDINMQFYEDMSTLLINAAKESKNTEVIELLLDHGADGSIQDLELNTAFDYAQNNKHIKDTDVFWRLNDSQYN